MNKSLYQLAIDALPVEIPERCLNYCVENEVALPPRYIVHGFNRGNRRDFTDLDACVEYIKQQCDKNGVNATLDEDFVCIDCHCEPDDYCGLEIMAKSNIPRPLNADFDSRWFSSVKDLFAEVLDHLDECLTKWDNNMHIHVGNREHTWGPVWINIVKVDYENFNAMIQSYVPKSDEDEEFWIPEGVAQDIALQRKVFFMEGDIVSKTVLNFYYAISRIAVSAVRFWDLKYTCFGRVNVYIGEYGKRKHVATAMCGKRNRKYEGIEKTRATALELLHQVMLTFGAANYEIQFSPFAREPQYGDCISEVRLL